MKFVWLVVGFGVAVAAAEAPADDRRWENPVFDSVDEAVAAATTQSRGLDSSSPRALRLFVDMTLAEADSAGSLGAVGTRRHVVDGLLVTHPAAFDRNEPPLRTIESFLEEVPRQRAVLVSGTRKRRVSSTAGWSTASTLLPTSTAPPATGCPRSAG